MLKLGMLRMADTLKNALLQRLRDELPDQRLLSYLITVEQQAAFRLRFAENKVNLGLAGRP